MSGVGTGPEPAGWTAHDPSRSTNVGSRLTLDIGVVIGSMGAGATSFGVLDSTSRGGVKSTGLAAATASGISIPCGDGIAAVTPARAAIMRVESMLTNA